jgi:hypothetical protein
MGDILLDGHIGEFRNDNLESQEPAVSHITRGMLVCLRLIDMLSLGITFFRSGVSFGSSEIYHQLCISIGTGGAYR